MGIEYWKSLEQLAESPEVLEKISQEFPGYDPDQITSISRRRFMQLMSASMALAGLTLNGCRRWPKQELAPYSSSPRERIPGIPEQYATVYEVGGVGSGLLVSSYDGRPIKIEGNPSHPFARTTRDNIGASDAYAQASVLELYDPDRSRSVIDRTGTAPRSGTWDQFRAAIAPLATTDGSGLAILSEASSSPSVSAMRTRLMQKFPQAKWYEYEPLSQANEMQALGRPVRTRLFLDKADVIVSLDADFLGSHPARIRYANDWARRRRSADSGGGMSRMYCAESCLTTTGSVADVRLGVRPSRVPPLAMALAARLGVAGATEPADLTAEEKQFIASAAADVKRNGVVVAGAQAPVEVHAIVHAINSAIGAYGNTITLLDTRQDQVQPVSALIDRLKAKNVSTLLVVGGNPVYDMPADAGFASLLGSVAQSVHLSTFENETSLACNWHLPRAHYLESWGDARAWDGTVSFQQPLILPLFGGKSTIELLAMFCGDADPDGRAIVAQTFASLTGNSSETAFRRVLHDGLLPESEYPTVTIAPAAIHFTPVASSTDLEVRFMADQSMYDGRFANNGWLQELPDSLSKLTWDNAALISKKDADAMGVTNGDMIRINIGERSLAIAAFIQPGQPIGTVGLPLGYGRTAAGKIGSGVGFNTYVLRTTTTMGSATGAKVSKANGTYLLAATQEHHILDAIGFQGREARIGEKFQSGSVIHEATFAEFEKNPRAAHGGHHAVSLPLFDPPSQFNNPHAWGMAIDMSTCIGCNACVAACQAENNIPIVGKEQVHNNREMHWLRIDRYFKGSMDDPNPEVVYQPMMCVHCENAPCEQVCPVAATVHDSEGLNVMVYNRCIGTRYCSNNCPYKVRRFNYFDWHSKLEKGLNATAMPYLGMPDSQQQDAVDKIRRMVFNPEVTVRMRGVMEKCTYCVQRIHNTQTALRNEGKDVVDGDVLTACQQACPTEAIVFGNLNESDAGVTKLHQNPRAYSVLQDLDTRPRTKHLAKLRNPNEPSGAASQAASKVSEH